MGWSEMPIVRADNMPCEVCNRNTRHRRVIYKDEEIRKCKMCNTRTIITFEDNEEIGRDRTRKKTDPPKKMGRPRKKRE